MQKNKIYVSIIFFMVFSLKTFACTIVAIEGFHHVYSAKVRDMFPDRQALMIYTPKSGYKYLALVSKTLVYQNESVPDKWVVRSGVNQFNLTILNQSNSYLFNGAVKDKYDDGDDFMRYVLTHYKTANDVINDMPKLIKQFNYPEFYTLADDKAIAYIEIAPHNVYKTKYETDGKFVHTNHYLLMPQYNVGLTESASSVVRFNQMAKLLNSTYKFSIRKLLIFLNNHSAGDNTSILRLGNPVSDPDSPRTIAQFIVDTSKTDNTSQVYIRLINVNEVYQLSLDPSFWAKYKYDQIISLN